MINEYGHWRKVRDWQGDEGWVHRTMLTGRRTAIVVAADSVLRADSRADGSIVARLEAGVVGRLVACPAAVRACRFAAEGVDGWVDRDALWGVYAAEILE